MKEIIENGVEIRLKNNQGVQITKLLVFGTDTAVDFIQ